MPRTFRTRTLSGPVCLLRTNLCLPWTRNAVTSDCQGAGFDSKSYGRRLALLKSDLRDALNDVQAHEKEIAAPVAHGARLALEEMEQGLRDLLQQLEERKGKRGRRV